MQYTQSYCMTTTLTEKSMSTVPRLSRVQKKGQVTIPLALRQKLELAEGDLVAFIETEHGVMLVPQTVIPTSAVRLPAAGGGEVNHSTLTAAVHETAITG